MTATASFDPDAAAGADSGMYGLPFTPDDAHVVVVPVPFEATTSYGGGTSRGPAAVREASKQVDLFDAETGKPYEAGIAMLQLPKKVVRWIAKAAHEPSTSATPVAVRPASTDSSSASRTW